MDKDLDLWFALSLINMFIIPVFDMSPEGRMSICKKKKVINVTQVGHG